MNEKFRFASSAVLLLFLLLFPLNSLEGATITERQEYRVCLASAATCTSLQLFSLELTGSIPTELNALTMLRELHWVATSSPAVFVRVDRDDNVLTGGIPLGVGRVDNAHYPQFEQQPA
jgi:hypothetical protein